MTNTTESSTILLVCIGMDSSEPLYRSLHLENIHPMLQPFGEVSRLLIFSKKTQLKAFVEFVSLDSAILARTVLHDSSLNHFGKIRLFFSAMQSLQFSNRDLEYHEYVAPKRASVCSHLSSTRLSVSETIALAESVLMFEENPLLTEEQPVRQVLGEKRHFFNTNSNQNGVSPFKRNSDLTMKRSPFNGLENVNGTQRSSLQVQNQNVQPMVRGSLFGKNGPAMISTQAQVTSVFQVKQVAPVFTGESESMGVKFGSDSGPLASQSAVLLVSNLQECFSSAAEIYAVFSCFGNISKVLLMKNLKKALVEFLSEEAAIAAVAGINLRVFGNTKVKVNFSKYRKIDLKKNNKSENSQHFNEVMMVSPEMRRYSDNGAHEASSPSNTVLIVMEQSDHFKPIDLFNHISEMGPVVGTRTLACEQSEEGTGLQKVLFKFRNEVEAIRMLAKCHNTMVNGVTLSGVFSQVCL